MSENHAPPMNQATRWIETVLFVLILVAGAALRLARLGSTPPGPSAEEAAHTHDALRVLAGEAPLAFATAEGPAHEPLYSYAAALVMLVAGKGYVAARLTSALLGTGLLVLVYVCVRVWTQNRWLALAAMAGLATSFWGMMVSRQAVRAITFPVLFTLTAVLMRRGIRVEEDIEDDFPPLRYRPQAEIEGWLWFALAGVALGASFYTYTPAHIMWLVFPAFFAFLSLTQPGVIRQVWPGLALMLGIAGLIAAPLVMYLVRHPADTLFSQVPELAEPMLQGNANALRLALRQGLGIITVRGDRMWLANIPARPLLGPILSLLFYVGVSVALMSLITPYRPARRGRRSYDDTFRITSANAFMLLVLLAGLVPVIVGGVDHSTLHAVGIQPVLFYFPALAVLWLSEWARRQVGRSGTTALWVAYAALLLVILAMTAHSYFAIWANAPAVQDAYPVVVPGA